jgi:hypothetical protein
VAAGKKRSEGSGTLRNEAFVSQAEEYEYHGILGRQTVRFGNQVPKLRKNLPFP